MRSIVVDANVVVKSFAQESDSKQAIEFFRACVEQDLDLIAPDLLRYEVLQIAIRKQYPVEVCLDLLENSISSLVEMLPPEQKVWVIAEKICQQGNKKSGFPSLYDSIYHAMAIAEDGLFITADHRHYVKADSYGHIALLRDWQSALHA